MREYIDRSATLSPCGTYRYTLRRAWDAARPTACWVMLNPSTADASADDATIRRVVGFADAWGYGGVAVVNLYAFRATDPKEMRRAADPVGPENDAAIVAAVGPAALVVAGWGANAAGRRAVDVVRLVRDAGAELFCLGVTGDGYPRHPLYLRGDVQMHAYGLSETGALVLGEGRDPRPVARTLFDI